jgi:hypothetical protein
VTRLIGPSLPCLVVFLHAADRLKLLTGHAGKQRDSGATAPVELAQQFVHPCLHLLPPRIQVELDSGLRAVRQGGNRKTKEGEGVARLRSILLLTMSFMLISGAGLSATAFAAPVARTAILSTMRPLVSGFPQCASPNDGAYWRSPSGILYQCRYVTGAGWQWVPILACGAGPAKAVYSRPTVPTCT